MQSFQFPDWGAIVAAVIAFLTGSSWLGRLQQRVNGHDEQLATHKEENDAAFLALNSKMEQHTQTSAEQWAKVNRALGRLEGHFGTRPVETNDGDGSEG